ncbi:biotin--[acetyl-CoA-carboxylase] ligase [Limibacter armeniacum]|uniref:biotin--[acetyl-CoA-carboxylase] ligase n=1 Tax=Limibacter armeniacum TaxID=466084 RepID=UPI002FE6B602
MHNFCTNTLFVGKKVVYLPTCLSTNTEAVNLAVSGNIPEGTVVYTSDQTAGRGQRGNGWESAPDKNLTLSLVLYPKFLLAREQFKLNMAISLAIHDCIGHATGIYPKVKWPNDIYVKEEKLTGILIENYLKGHHINYSVIGIGLNVNQVDFSTPTATSIANMTGKQFNLYRLMESLLENIEKRYLQLKAGKDDLLKTEYLQALFWYQEEHTFAEACPDGSFNEFTGVILGVDPHGKLVLKTPWGFKEYGFKEVKFMIGK